MYKRISVLTVTVLLLLCQFQCKTVSTVSFSLRIISGDAQTGYMGQLLPQPVVIRVEDSDGNPQPGAVVQVTVVLGGGTVGPSSLSADSSGNVSIQWELGSDYRNRLRVTLQAGGEQAGAPPTVEVNATSLYVYRTPEEIADGWDTDSLENLPVYLPNLVELIDRIRSENYVNIHSLLIVKSGKLVLEEYWSGFNSNGTRIEYDRNTKHEVQSASKSVRSALIGIAVDHGFIGDENERLFSFFPEYGHLNTEVKNRITLKHVLTMSSGFEWHENDYPFTDPRNDLSQMYDLPSSEWARYVLERPMAAEPGTVWLYNTGASLMLSDILTKVTGMRADYFADIYLYNKMESRNVADYWPPLASGLIPRDMAKLGQVYLNNGKWKDTRIVSEAWVRVSTQKYFSPGPGSDYGYLWWHRSFTLPSETFDSFYASGNGGQFIFVFPGLDMVVVFTGGNFNSSMMFQAYDMLEDFVLPAFVLLDN
jgi:CubicO group peptidase (beta-lactamase class C family)